MDAGIFISWGTPVHGRETFAAARFKDATALWERLQRSGEIESYELVSLEPHAGTINDFFLLRGDQDQLARLRISDEFVALSRRANAVLWNFRTVGADVGAGAWTKVREFEATAEKWATGGPPG